MSATTKLPTFVSFFCGCGGLDAGFEDSGFAGLGAYDIDPVAIDAHNVNLRTHAVACDLSRNVEFGLPRPPDVVVAGSPCQGFSTIGKRFLDDPRNSLLVQATRLAVKLKPRAILLENVAGVLSGHHSKYMAAALTILTKSGYKHLIRRLVCADYGVPQIRKRVVLIASRRDCRDLPELETSQPVSIRTALHGAESLPGHEPIRFRKNTDDFRIASRIGRHQKLCDVRAGTRSVPSWHIPEVFGRTTQAERAVLEAVRRLRRTNRLRAFGDADPVTLRDIAHYCGRSCTEDVYRLCTKGFLRKTGQRFDLARSFNGKYRRLAWEHQAPAVDTRFGQPRYFLHPDEPRGFSAREAARIQGFPDHFIWEVPRAAQFRLIGNAVPPPLARLLAALIRDHLL